eukprot:8724304-Alexandrium_andersonii.AAC.1
MSTKALSEVVAQRTAASPAQAVDSGIAAPPWAGARNAPPGRSDFALARARARVRQAGSRLNSDEGSKYGQLGP